MATPNAASNSTPNNPSTPGSDAKKVQTKRFQARTRKLLDLMIHSVYSDKEVFLRELISNASDAIDKVRFLALTDAELAKGDHDYKIELIVDKDARTLTIRDNGVGMSEEDVVRNLGTIARSGTEEFLEKLAKSDRSSLSPELIGRFGLGFYSSFMVASDVTVQTYRFGEEHGIQWKSTGGGTYTIETTPPGKRGTSVILKINDEQPTDTEDEAPAGQDFLDTWTLKAIVKKHSDFVQWPIVMDIDKVDYEKKEDGSFDYSKPIHETVTETLNSQKALWTRDKDSITDDEYNEFYKHVTHDWQDPSDRLHVRVEGTHEYTALMYLPKGAPYDLYTREAKRGLALYVKGVFIMDECRELMPEYLRFVRGLVDSPDLPLNLSREMVQQDRLIRSMRKVLTKKWLGHFDKMLRDDREAYETMWAEFGQALKEGFHYDAAMKDRLSKLLLVRTTHNDGWTTLAEYVERMSEGQEDIYYLAGDNLTMLRESPVLEGLADAGKEVLLFVDPVDEIMLSALDAFDEKSLKDAARGDIDLGDKDESKDDEEKKADESDVLAPLVEKLGAALGETVDSVRVSKRLKSSAAVLVTPDGGLSPQMEKMMKAMGQPAPEQKRMLELNPDHALIKKLADLVKSDADDERIAAFGELLYGQALLSEGGQLKNPAKFARQVADVMARSL